MQFSVLLACVLLCVALRFLRFSLVQPENAASCTSELHLPLSEPGHDHCHTLRLPTRRDGWTGGPQTGCEKSRRNAACQSARQEQIELDARERCAGVVVAGHEDVAAKTGLVQQDKV